MYRCGAAKAWLEVMGIVISVKSGVNTGPVRCVASVEERKAENFLSGMPVELDCKSR